MKKLLAPMRYIAWALALVTLVAFAAPAVAQTNSDMNAVKEQQLLQQFKMIQGRGTIPDVKSYVLEQPVGRNWQRFNNVTLRWIGGIAILGMLAALVVFYLWRGMVKIQSGRSGRVIVRFNAFERFVHWMTATCFIILAVTGLNVTFGRALFASTGGSEAFTAWSEWAKYAHNFLSFPFTLGVVLIFLMWIGGNIPNRVDVEWLKRGGGILNNDHPPAYRFNAGQKTFYWIVVLCGSVAAITGYILMFPFYGTTIDSMQYAEMTHATVGVLFIAVMLAHIYIGTLGMEGAFEAMGEGTVDINWAKEHHSLWLEEEASQSDIARARATPAE
jgi:formate dehydrogenase subunit gamma